MDSSSDESVEEEIPVGVLRIPEMPSAAYGLKPVLDEIFFDIQASIPSLDLEDSSGESSDGKEPVAFPSKEWSLLHSNVSGTIPPGSELITSPAESTTDSGMSLISQDIQTTSNSSLSDCDQDSIEFHSTSPMPQDSEETISNQTISPDVNQVAGKQLYSLEKVYEENTLDGKTEPTSFSSSGSNQQGFALKFDLIEQLNLSHLVENTSDVTIPELFPPIVSDSELDDIDARITENSDNLMVELAMLSRRQQENAAPEPDKQFHKHSQGILTTLDQLTNKMHASVGVTACTCPTETRSNDTVFLDLRNQADGTCNLRHQTLPPSISRILGIRRGAEDDLSSSDGEDDLVQWQQKRRKAKEASVSCTGGEKNGTKSQEQAVKQTALKTGQGSVSQRIHGRETAVKQIPYTRDIQTRSEKPVAGFDTFMYYKTVREEQKKVKNVKSTEKAVAGFGSSMYYSTVKEEQKEKNVKSAETEVAEFDSSMYYNIVKEEEKEIKKVRSTEKAVAEFDSSVYYKTVKQDEEEILLRNERCPTQFQHVPEEKESATKKIVKEIDKSKEEREIIIPPAEEKSESLLAKKDEVVSLTAEKGCSAKGKEEFKERKDHQRHLTPEEKAKRQRLQKSLQNLKDHFSSLADHPPAPSTPVIFHEEASYESTISSLPRLEKSEKNPFLLLCAKLSSCGELAVVRQGPRGIPTSDTYCISALVAWLTCLVPPPYGTSCIDYAEVCGVPFHVVGLQQSWHDGQLSVEIGICSRACKTEEPSGQETKRKNKANCSFKQTVARFLSTNTLHDVFNRLSEFTPSFQKTFLSEVMISKRNLSTLLSVNPDPCAMQRVLGAVPSFFWQTVQVEDMAKEERIGPRFCQGPEVQNTVMLMKYDAYHEPACVLDVLVRAHRRSLDLAGIRLSYQWQEMLEEKPAFQSQCHNWWNSEQSHVPLLALALRGPQAITRWQDEVGPVDAKLAQRTDPSSLRALYSNGSKDDRFFWCPRNLHSADAALVRWFGGRVPASGVINVGCDEVANKNPHRGQTENSHLLTSTLPRARPRPPCFLTASTDSCVFLFVSPVVPVRFLGHVLWACYQRGFCIQGIRRIHLNVTRLSGLGLSQEQMSVLCPKRTNLSETQSLPLLASTVLLLNRENALHNVFSLIESLVTDLAEVSACQCSFLAFPYSDTILKQLGGNFSQTPNPAAHSLDLMRHAFHSNPELEQVCIVTLLKEKATMSAGTILNQLLIGEEFRKVEDVSGKESQKVGSECTVRSCGFELLGLKFLPSLSMYQAKEFTPCVIGDKLWQSSLRTLTSSPALIIALRGTDAFSRVSHFINSYMNSSILKTGKKDDNSLDMFVSCTPELAYRQLSIVFYDRELFSDESARRDLHLIPPPRRVIGGGMSGGSESLSGAVSGNLSGGKSQKCLRALLGKLPLKSSLSCVETLCHGDLSVIQSLLAGPRPIPTVCLLKPCTAAKHLGKVLKRLAQEGFTVINMKMMLLSTSVVSEMMMKKEGDLECHVSYMTSGPVVALCLQRENAVGRLLDLLGPSDPAEARRKCQFFLRSSFGQDSVRNALYGSETYEDAIKDVKLLFPDGVCCPSTMDLKAEEIPCLAPDEVVSFTAIRTLMELSDEEQACFDSTPEITRSLLEINCLLLLPQFLTCRTVPGRKANPSYVEIIEALLSAGFHIIGLRMVLLGVPEAAECAKLLSGSLPTDWSPCDLVNKLSQPSCVVMAVLRDNAVTCFDSLCDSFPKLKSLANSYGKYVLAGKTVKEANRMVERFFDHLMPNRKAKIVCSAS